MMEIELLKVRCVKIRPSIIPQNHVFTTVPQNFISQKEFLIWVQSKSFNVFHSVRKDQFFGLYKFWREIIPYCRNGNRNILSRIVHSDNSLENGLIYHLNVEGEHKRMNHVLGKMLSKVESKKTPEHFGEIILHADEKNMGLFKNCWDERVMISKSMPDIIDGNTDYIDKLILHVGISPEFLAKRVFDLDYDEAFENMTLKRIMFVGMKIKDHLEKNYGVKIEIN